MVGSSPFFGDAVTVILTAGGTCASTSSVIPLRGKIS
jgi:hypothetical protein